jgi:hypothetical protein
MLRALDHTITRQVRAALKRRWIDSEHLAFGSVNGVVYMRGALGREPLAAVPPIEGDSDLSMIHALERELRAIDGVKDVVLELSGYERQGDRWTRMSEVVADEETGSRPKAAGSRPELASGSGGIARSGQ